MVIIYSIIYLSSFGMSLLALLIFNLLELLHFLLLMHPYLTDINIQPVSFEIVLNLVETIYSQLFILLLVNVNDGVD